MEIWLLAIYGFKAMGSGAKLQSGWVADTPLCYEYIYMSKFGAKREKDKKECSKDSSTSTSAFNFQCMEQRTPLRARLTFASKVHNAPAVDDNPNHCPLHRHIFKMLWNLLWKYYYWNVKQRRLSHTSLDMIHCQMLGKVEYGLPAKIWRLVGCTEMLSWLPKL